MNKNMCIKVTESIHQDFNTQSHSLMDGWLVQLAYILFWFRIISTRRQDVRHVNNVRELKRVSTLMMSLVHDTTLS